MMRDQVRWSRDAVNIRASITEFEKRSFRMEQDDPVHNRSVCLCASC